MGAVRRQTANRARNLERVFTIFPRLKERTRQLAGTMSGGEQQMLAIGRGLMAEPKLLILDEPSLGLSPLLVEQNASRALGLANRGYVMDSGEITMSGAAQALLSDPKVRAAYLGE